MLILHHNDLDGRCAAAVCYRFGGIGATRACYIEMNYDKPLPLDKVVNNETVVFLDFYCSDNNQFAKLKEKAGEVIIINHHKTFKEKIGKYSELYSGVKIVYDKTLSGCEIAWNYYCGPNSIMPRAVKLIGDYDALRWEFGEETARFCAGVWTYILSILLVIFGDVYLSRNPLRLLMKL